MSRCCKKLLNLKIGLCIYEISDNKSSENDCETADSWRADSMYVTRSVQAAFREINVGELIKLTDVR